MSRTFEPRDFLQEKQNASLSYDTVESEQAREMVKESNSCGEGVGKRKSMWEFGKSIELWCIGNVRRPKFMDIETKCYNVLKTLDVGDRSVG